MTTMLTIYIVRLDAKALVASAQRNDANFCYYIRQNQAAL
jgi:hypothetical protein